MNALQQRLKKLLGTANDGESLNMIPVYVLGALLLGVVVLVWSMIPRKGTVFYGACKTYVELHTHYPNTIDVLDVIERGGEIRMRYKQIDAYGYSFNDVVCKFKRNDDGRVVLDSVNLNRGTEYPMEKDSKIEDFNEVIGIILKNPSDLTLPPPMPEDIADFR